MKLLIAIPTRDQMPFQFVESLTKLVRRLEADNVDFDVEFKGGTLVYVGRDALAKRAISDGYSHILWLDADMVFTEDLFDDLMDSHKDIITGIAHSRRAPYPSCVFTEVYPNAKVFDGEYPSDVFEIAGCGMACCLMNVDVLRAIWERHETCFFPSSKLGEDLAFCQRATEGGWKIYADPHVQVGHVGQMVIYPEYRDIFKESIQR